MALLHREGRSVSTSITEEFYEIYDGHFDIGPLNKSLMRCQQTYNAIRPHQALGYVPPTEYLAQHIARKARDAGTAPDAGDRVLSRPTTGIPGTTLCERREVCGIT